MFFFPKKGIRICFFDAIDSKVAAELRDIIKSEFFKIFAPLPELLNIILFFCCFKIFGINFPFFLL